MVKINREKIVKAAVGSARLEGYKGTPKAAAEKKAGAPRADVKPGAKR
jgi:hypothetical protein